jgi:hypothetical protein
MVDKGNMWMTQPPPKRDRFLDHAAAILDTAVSAEGQEDWTILVSGDGALRMLAANNWPLESLAREQGAQMAFRVTRTGAGTRVEGCQGLRTCSFTSEPSAASMQRILAGPALYQLA